MSNARMVAFPCWPFELFSLKELYRGKLVHSIVSRARMVAVNSIE